MVTRLVASMLLFALATGGPVAWCATPAGSSAASSPALATPALGTAAPAFSLPDQNGNPVSLADKRGHWVVLYFYPKDNTPGCTTEACDFRDNIFAFRERGAVVLGISVDDVSSHKEFANQHHLPFPILADSDKQVARQYGVLHRPLGLLELARRETFIIDPQGILVKHYRDVNPDDHSQQVLMDLRALQAAARPLATH